MAKQAKPTPPKAMHITLKHPHEHAGVVHPAGATIDVWPDQAERIRAAEARIDAEHAANQET